MSASRRLGLRLKTSIKLAPQLHQALHLLQLNQSQLDSHLREVLERNPMLSLDHSQLGGVEDLDGWVSAPLSLADHLLTQLMLLPLSPRQQALAEALVYALDARGYLVDDLNEVALSAALQPAASAAELLPVLRQLQSLEPAGIAATSLTDCLSRQLLQKRASAACDLALVLLNECPMALQHQDYEAMMRHAQVDATALQAALAQLQQLDPSPGLQYSDSRLQHRIPDLRVGLGDTGWQLTLHPGSQAQLSLCPNTLKLLETAKGRDRDFLQRALQEARQLIDGLSLRAVTLTRVASEVVRAQSDFLADPQAPPQALTQAQVAARLKLHPSTVSRAVRDKTLLTPRGLIALQQLFSVSLPAAEGLASAAAAQQQLRQCIQAEPALKPLSDQQLVCKLTAAGLPLSRRTVAKYRQLLGIPNAAQRRRKRHFQTVCSS